MPRGAHRGVVDLLIVGGLTVDHFPDGSTAPGGTVLHGARAARDAGLTVGIVTVAGGEPEAQIALAELGELVAPGALSVQPAARSIAFRHEEAEGARTLTVLDPGEPLAGARATAARRELQPRAVLYGPVAGELAPDFVDLAGDGALTAATLQGWLRSLVPGRPVTALGFDGLDAALVRRLAACDLLVASSEDLAAVAREPAEQLDELRRHVGRQPILALTRGAAGSILEDPDGGRLTVLPSRLPVRGATIGAGDAFASLLVAHLAAGTPIPAAAEAASAAAAAYLVRTARHSSHG